MDRQFPYAIQKQLKHNSKIMLKMFLNEYVINKALTTDKKQPKYKFIKCFDHSEFDSSFEMWDLTDNTVTFKFSHGIELILNSDGTFQLTNMAGDTV